ncbi:endonuclease domain-containing protein [Sedimenticola sp.]|uniref:endonuclease domain-containing protein n=1 Tax=Sedimenticola sp. TaxID=1940285 RepID=UPI003D09DC50
MEDKSDRIPAGQEDSRARESERLQSRARRLRRQASEAELLLWQRLRNHQMRGYKFRRQVVIDPYIADFVCLEAKLIVEADGGQHAEQANYDTRRTTRLEEMGYKVLRFWNHEILGETDAVLERIASALLEC